MKHARAFTSGELGARWCPGFDIDLHFDSTRSPVVTLAHGPLWTGPRPRQQQQKQRGCVVVSSKQMPSDAATVIFHLPQQTLSTRVKWIPQLHHHPPRGQIKIPTTTTVVPSHIISRAFYSGAILRSRTPQTLARYLCLPKSNYGKSWE